MIHLVVALPAEARPLAEGFGLCPGYLSGPFRLYEGAGIRMILSGPGKRAVRSAVEQLHALHPDPRLWLNIGIAGHGIAELGTLFLAREILDQATGSRFHPLLPSPPPCATTVLCTVDQPEEKYAQPWAYDMEGSSFFEAASPRAVPGQVHCLKIVSDNPHTSHRRISAKRVEKLIRAQIGRIEEVIAQLFA